MKSRIPPEIITSEIEDHCTCAEYDWPEAVDPYLSDLYNETRYISACPYCYSNRVANI